MISMIKRMINRLLNHLSLGNKLPDLFLFLISVSFCSFATGSERLELYFLSEKLLNNKIVPVQDVIQFNIKSRSLGFKGFSSGQEQNYPVALEKGIYPILAYSDNINGGNLSQTIQVGDFTFVGEEEANAKSGLIFGGGIFLGMKKIYDRGRYLDFNVNASLAAAPTHEWLTIRNESINACSRNYVKEWYFFDACANWKHNKRQFSDVISKSLSASLTRLFRVEKTFNEGSFTLKRFMSDEYQQMQGTFALNSLLPNGFKTNFSITAGEPVTDLISLNYSVGTTISKHVKKRPLRFSLNQTLYDGGKFLGMSRKDITQKISLTYPIHSTFNTSLGYTRNVSSISSFSYNGPHIEVSFPTRSF